jgi:hypothetical protein
MMLLSMVVVDKEGFGGWVLAMKVAGTEKSAAYGSLLWGLVNQAPKELSIIIGDKHEGIKAVVAEIAGGRAAAVHGSFRARRALARAASEVTENLKAIYRECKTATNTALYENENSSGVFMR